ncbi:hypothetical protein HYY71_00560 [Candidatus Woesearchaeota archaeon]|nr:hypothetical protein [Candidatus Woesearchaeota archaeon]
MGGLHKKSEVGIVIILIIVIVLFFFGWLINFSQRECRTNRDCNSESYCGSDFACHSYPNIQKTVVQYNFFWPAVIIGIAIVAAAWIFRKWRGKWDKIQFVEKIVKVPEEAEAISEPYYKSNGNLRTP